MIITTMVKLVRHSLVNSSILQRACQHRHMHSTTNTNMFLVNSSNPTKSKVITSRSSCEQYPHPYKVITLYQ